MRHPVFFIYMFLIFTFSLFKVEIEFEVESKFKVESQFSVSSLVFLFCNKYINLLTEIYFIMHFTKNSKRTFLFSFFSHTHTHAYTPIEMFWFVFYFFKCDSYAFQRREIDEGLISIT